MTVRCPECEKGKFKSNPSRLDCELCPAGTYDPTQGRGLCLDYPVNFQVLSPIYIKLLEQWQYHHKRHLRHLWHRGHHSWSERYHLLKRATSSEGFLVSLSSIFASAVWRASLILSNPICTYLRGFWFLLLLYYFPLLQAHHRAPEIISALSGSSWSVQSVHMAEKYAESLQRHELQLWTPHKFL